MSTRIGSNVPEQSQIEYVEVGQTEGDAAGYVYLLVPNVGLFVAGPNRAGELATAITAAKDQAKIDASTKKVTISVTPSMTDAQIVTAVRAAVGSG